MDTNTAKDQVIELTDSDGSVMLWKRKKGATTSGQDFIAAWWLMSEIRDQAEWNPWVTEERAAEYEQAQSVWRQWTRAEPGHRYLTMREIRAQQARRRRRWEREREAVERRRKDALKGYDPVRSEARLRLIERESRLAHVEQQLAGHADRSLFPAMDARTRAERVAELELDAASLRAELAELGAVVGDPEAVVDQAGWLPSDRRQAMLSSFRFDRQQRVPELRAALEALRDQVASAPAGERRLIRDQIRRSEHILDALLQIPELSAEDMCSECPTPARFHGWLSSGALIDVIHGGGPCPYWPSSIAKRREVEELLRRIAERNRAVPATAPPTGPVAVLQAGVPINDLMDRLAEIQKQYPRAEVRKGRAGRWEIFETAAAPPP